MNRLGLFLCCLCFFGLDLDLFRSGLPLWNAVDVDAGTGMGTVIGLFECG
jgi:hypothetical protein